MGLDNFDSEEWKGIENKVSFLEDDINRMNWEVEDLKEKYEKIITILLSLDKDMINEEAKKRIGILRDSIANSATQIIRS